MISVSNHKLLFLYFVIILLAQPVNAKEYLQRDIQGTWKGVIRTLYGGVEYKSDLSIQFLSGEEARFQMARGEKCTYKISRDLISLFFEGEPMAIIISNIEISSSSLKGKIQLPRDPIGLDANISLSRLESNASITPTQQLPCNNLPASDKVRTIISKYNLPCPIKIPTQATWYEYSIIGEAISEIIKSVFGTSYKVQFFAGKYFVITGRDNRAIESIVKPLLENQEQFYAVDCSMCLVEIPRIGDLKPDLISNGKINFERVWGDIIPAIEKVNGLRVDLTTEVKQTEQRSIKTKFSRVPINDPGYIIAEQVTVTIADAYQKTEPGIGVQISVISRILRRGVSERQWIEVNLSSYASGSVMGIKTFDQENPCMKSILNAIKS